jgi:hypothetical protein
MWPGPLRQIVGTVEGIECVRNELAYVHLVYLRVESRMELMQQGPTGTRETYREEMCHPFQTGGPPGTQQIEVDRVAFNVLASGSVIRASVRIFDRAAVEIEMLEGDRAVSVWQRDLQRLLLLEAVFVGSIGIGFVVFVVAGIGRRKRPQPPAAAA